MVSFVNNPYKDCDEDNITSAVVALELKGSNGSNMLISGLENDIDIRIRHRWRSFDFDRESFVLQLNGDSSHFHTFNYSFPHVAVAIEFLSRSENVSQWTIMVASGGRPPAQSNLASWSFNEKHRTFLLLESSSFTDIGTYYVGLKATPKIQRSSSEKSVSVNVSYSLKISALKCLFWDEGTQGWSQDGCRVSVVEYLLFSS